MAQAICLKKTKENYAAAVECPWAKPLDSTQHATRVFFSSQATAIEMNGNANSYSRFLQVL